MMEEKPAHGVIWRSYETDEFPKKNQPQWRGQPYAIEVPGFSLREASSVGDLGLWYTIGEAWAHLATHFAQTIAPRVLDIGCGSGKMARFFIMNPRARYIGLDVFAPSIEWCQVAFKSHPRFEFRHLDVHSSLYNPNGKMQGHTVTLPVEDGSSDIVICGSLFTHLLEPAFRRYLHEVRRALSSNGRALVSIHDEPTDGRFSGDEVRIDISREYWAEIVTESGLKIIEHVGNVFGQQFYVLGK